MEGAGTGGINLEPRVEQIEQTVRGLTETQREIHKDNREMKAALAGIGVRQQGQDAMLQDIASKLDAQRTRKPELSSIAAVTGVLLVIWGLSLTPIYWRIDRMFTTMEKIQDVQSYTVGVISQYTADRIHIERELDKSSTWRQSVTGTLYGKEEGQRLENKLDRHIEDAARRGLK